MFSLGREPQERGDQLMNEPLEGATDWGCGVSRSLKTQVDSCRRPPRDPQFNGIVALCRI